MKIITWPDPILAEPSEYIHSIDPMIEEIAKGMVKTMFENNGNGLAANQIGEPIRLVVMNDVGTRNQSDNSIVLINPEIVESSDIKGAVEELCLSLPGIAASISRSVEILVKYTDINGENVERRFYGLLARIIQHETDHLDGIMFPDRFNRKAKRELYSKVRKFNKERKR